MAQKWPNKVPRWVFRYVGNKTYDFSSKKKDFLPKTTKNGPKLAFLVDMGQAMQAYSVAGAATDDTSHVLLRGNRDSQHKPQSESFVIPQPSLGFSPNQT